MNERRADLTVVGVFLAGIAMMTSIAMVARLQIVCVVVGVVALAMVAQRGQGPFSPSIRRQLRGLVLVVATVCCAGLFVSTLHGFAPWCALIVLTAVTYVSLRVRMFRAPRTDEPPRAS